MANFNYDTYCGIYCGACSIHMAYETGRKDKFACHWTESNLKAHLQSQGITPADGESMNLKCHGCKTDTLFINCRHCKIRGCAISRNIEHCNDCSEYPCKLFNDSLSNPNIVKILPHLKAAPVNLITVKDVGVNQWLKDQGKQWQCPDCHTKFSWYEEKCCKCGRELGELKDYNYIKE